MRKKHIVAVGLAAVGALVVQTGSVAAPSGEHSVTRGQQTALDLGIQLAPKSSIGARSAPSSPNPFLANLHDIADADYFSWIERMKAQEEARMTSPVHKEARRQAFGVSAAALPPAVVHDEQEPAGSSGSNDTAPDAEPVDVFGTATAKSPRVRILGQLANLGGPTPRTITTAEDQGAIPLATDTAIVGSGAVTTSSVLGDGPHGSVTGDGSNDVDFYQVNVGAGQTITANTEGSATGLDTVLAVYDAAGEALAADDDGGTGVLSNLTFKPETPGDYYVLVAGYDLFGPLPNDPFDSGSGNGGADEGAYNLAIGVTVMDADFYALRLRAGDVLGGVGKGAAFSLGVTTPAGEERVGAAADNGASALYPPQSPLPGGGNTTIAYVAEETGWYAVEVGGAVGAYDVLVEGYRPGAQTDRSRTTQTVVLDFEPGRVNTGIWGGPGVRDVSPFTSFVPRWGIARADARKVENRIVNQVRANLQAEIAGTNPAVGVEVLNARGNEALIGQENVSRVYVAGTIAETGLDTIGIAQYIDPGNYGHEDQAIVLLDVLSAPAGPESSLNTYLTPASDRIAFVSKAVANVTAHEVGHTVGNYHTDNANGLHNLMDSGGASFGVNLYGVGPDNLGGTADDENIEFQTDTYSPVEGFTGLENTENVTSWAYAGR